MKSSYKITAGHLGDLRAAAFGHPELEEILEKMENEHGFEIVPYSKEAASIYDYSVLFMYPNKITLLEKK